MIHIQDECWQDFANAIVVSAVDDWKRSKLKLSKPSLASRQALDTSRSCERFFLSPWFNMLTGLDGKYVLSQLKRNYGYTK